MLCGINGSPSGMAALTAATARAGNIAVESPKPPNKPAALPALQSPPHSIASPHVKSTRRIQNPINPLVRRCHIEPSARPPYKCLAPHELQQNLRIRNPIPHHSNRRIVARLFRHPHNTRMQKPARRTEPQHRAMHRRHHLAPPDRNARYATAHAPAPPRASRHPTQSNPPAARSPAGKSPSVGRRLPRSSDSQTPTRLSSLTAAPQQSPTHCESDDHPQKQRQPNHEINDQRSPRPIERCPRRHHPLRHSGRSRRQTIEKHNRLRNRTRHSHRHRTAGNVPTSHQRQRHRVRKATPPSHVASRIDESFTRNSRSTTAPASTSTTEDRTAHSARN